MCTRTAINLNWAILLTHRMLRFMLVFYNVLQDYITYRVA